MCHSLKIVLMEAWTCELLLLNCFKISAWHLSILKSLSFHQMYQIKFSSYYIVAQGGTPGVEKTG